MSTKMIEALTQIVFVKGTKKLTRSRFFLTIAKGPLPHLLARLDLKSSL